MRGFTCAFRDLLLTAKTETERASLVINSRTVAKATSEKWLEQFNRAEFADGKSPPELLAEAARDILPRNNPEQVYESMTIGKMKENWSDMINKCIPVGQKIPVPINNFASMVQTGAKGSKVNHSQICCCLGQQELEGRLPPLM